MCTASANQACQDENRSIMSTWEQINPVALRANQACQDENSVPIRLRQRWGPCNLNGSNDNGNGSNDTLIVTGVRPSSCPGWPKQFYTKSFSILKTSGNEVYYTNPLLLPTKMMLCSKLHCQKFFELKLFSYKIVQPTPASGHDEPGESECQANCIRKDFQFKKLLAMKFTTQHHLCW